MIHFALAIALALPQDTSKAKQARAQEDLRDRWVAEDKFKHFSMSFAITSFGFAGMRGVSDNNDTNRTVAVSAGVVAGLLKEVNDKRNHLPFSLRDLLWDFAGVAAGYAMIKQAR